MVLAGVGDHGIQHSSEHALSMGFGSYEEMANDVRAPTQLKCNKWYWETFVTDIPDRDV